MKPIALTCLIFLALTSGCTFKQAAQFVYDSAKSDECMKREGVLECDLDDR